MFNWLKNWWRKRQVNNDLTDFFETEKRNAKTLDDQVFKKEK